MPKLVMLMLDAFGYTNISKKYSPFLYQLATNSIFGEIKPLFAFRGIEPTIFSGLYPDQHNIWLDYYYDPNHSPFRWTYNPLLLFLNLFVKNIQNLYLKKILTAPICYTTQTINKFTQFPRTTMIPWDLLKFFNISMVKSIIEKNSIGKIHTLFDILRDNNMKSLFINFPYTHSDKDTMKMFRRYYFKKKKFDFSLIRFFDLDTISHKNGPNSPKFNMTIKKTDIYIKEIIETLKKKDDDYLFLIISDHGMVKINKILNILSYLKLLNLKIGKDYQLFLDSTLARFYTKIITIQEKIKQQLNNLKEGHFLTIEDKKRLHIPITAIYGDLIFASEPGTLILPNFYQGSQLAKGMHGYYSIHSDLNALFILNGKKISPRKLKKQINFIDILPTILEILNLPPKKGIIGKSVLKKFYSE
ncbi:MAG: alkaline phosphatase family protein [Promethearchaeota archaeon]